MVTLQYISMLPPPDITSNSSAPHSGVLDRVGMENVEIPIRFVMGDGKEHTVPARCGLYVNITDPDAKGIHMSRLFILANEALTKNVTSLELLQKTAEEFIKSHKEISSLAELHIEFEYMNPVDALKTKNTGWRFYNTSLRVQVSDRGSAVEQSVEVTYSSTCPCSTALSKQLLQHDFHTAFEDSDTVSKQEVLNWIESETTEISIPHSQRSLAAVTVSYESPESAVSINQLISLTEQAIATPVQAAVKREDEQAFAKLSGENLMFAEDAARRIKSMLNTQSEMTDFHIAIRHLESLHAHDAVVYASKV